MSQNWAIFYDNISHHFAVFPHPSLSLSGDIIAGWLVCQGIIITSGRVSLKVHIFSNHIDVDDDDDVKKADFGESKN